MCRQYLAYKIPTYDLSSGKCRIVTNGTLKTCGCGRFTFVIVAEANL